MVFSSSCTSNTFVRTPGLAKFGAWRTALAKWLLPHVAHDGSRRDLDDQGCAALAAGAARAAGRAGFGVELAVVAEVQQRVHAGVGHKDDVPAAAAVPAVGAAGLDELFAVEADLAVPAVPGLEFDANDIDKC